MFRALLGRPLRIGMPVAVALLPATQWNASMTGSEDSDSDSGKSEGYEDGGTGKECSTAGWWHFGCNRTCFGRTEKIACIAAGGGVTPNAVFNCPGCGFVFHGDCLEMTKAEKKRIQRAPRNAPIAACPACINIVQGTWRHAAKDTARVFEAIMRAVVLPSEAKDFKAQLQAIASGVQMGVEELKIIRKEYRHVASGDQDDAGPRRDRVNQTMANLLLERMPVCTLFDPDAVQLLTEISRKETAPSPDRCKASRALQPPPSIQKAGSSLLFGSSHLLARGKRLKWDPTDDDEEDGEEGGGGPSGGSGGLSGGSSRMKDIKCLVCGAANQWCKNQGFLRHLQNAGGCTSRKGVEAGTLGISEVPLDQTVVNNLRRVQYQALFAKAGRKKGGEARQHTRRRRRF